MVACTLFSVLCEESHRCVCCVVRTALGRARVRSILGTLSVTAGQRGVSMMTSRTRISVLLGGKREAR